MKSPTLLPPDMKTTISSSCNKISTPPELDVTLLSTSTILSDNNTTMEENMTSTSKNTHPVQITSVQGNIGITSPPLYDNEDNKELEDNPEMKDTGKSEDNTRESARNCMKTNKMLHLLPPSNKDNPKLKTTKDNPKLKTTMKSKDNSRTKRNKPSDIQKNNIRKYFCVKKSDNIDGETKVPKTDERDIPEQADSPSISQTNALDKQPVRLCEDSENLRFNQSQTEKCDPPDLAQSRNTFTSKHLGDKLIGPNDHLI